MLTPNAELKGAGGVALERLVRRGERMETMATYRVRFMVETPVEATEQEVEDWVRFYLHETGSLSGKNPLVEHDLEAKRGSVDAHRLSY